MYIQATKENTCEVKEVRVSVAHILGDTFLYVNFVLIFLFCLFLRGNCLKNLLPNIPLQPCFMDPMSLFNELVYVLFATQFPCIIKLRRNKREKLLMTNFEVVHSFCYTTILYREIFSSRMILSGTIHKHSN